MVFGKSKNPLYYQLAELIKNEIEEKGLKVDDKIPTEREYCERYNLSRATVRQAISYLEQQGYLYKVQGCGTFVSSRVYKQKLLKFYSFTDEMKKQGKTPESEILSFEKKLAGEIGKELNLSAEDFVIELIRLRMADKEKIMFEKTYLPLKKFSNLSEKDLQKNSLYGILEERYGITFTKALERFSVTLSDESISKVLGIDKNEALMKVQRWTYTGLEVIEYTISYVRGDRFEFEVELEENSK